MIELDFEIEFDCSENGPFGIMRYSLNRKERDLNEFSPGYFLGNDYNNGVNRQNHDFQSETLKNWETDLL